MSYPEHGAGYRSNGKSVLRMANAQRADGGDVERQMAAPGMKPTDPAVTADDVKTWGSADNARAAARAREHASERYRLNPFAEREDMGAARQQMGRGIGQSIGFKRGGAVKRRADGGLLAERVEPLIDQRGRMSSDVDANEPPVRLSRPSSPQAAQDAREQAAKRIRNTRATPDSFAVGGERASGGKVSAKRRKT